MAEGKFRLLPDDGSFLLTAQGFAIHDDCCCGPGEPSGDCEDCNTNCPWHATTNQPTVEVSVSGTCTDDYNLCSEADDDPYVFRAYSPTYCTWSWATFTGLDPGYCLVLECRNGYWYAFIYHNSGGEMPTLTPVYEGNPAVFCTGGKLWAAFDLPGTDGTMGTHDCDGCTASVTIAIDPD